MTRPIEPVPLVTGVISPAQKGLTFRVITNEEWAELDALWAEEVKEEEQRKAVLAACEHDWRLYLNDPEAAGPENADPNIEIWCERCHGNANEVYNYFLDQVYVEFDDVVVSYGRHDLVGRTATVPITIETWSCRNWTDYGWEWDAGVEIDTCGPAEYQDIEP